MYLNHFLNLKAILLNTNFHLAIYIIHARVAYLISIILYIINLFFLSNNHFRALNHFSIRHCILILKSN